MRKCFMEFILFRQLVLRVSFETSGVPTGVWGVQTPSEIPKVFQKCAKGNPICENC